MKTSIIVWIIVVIVILIGGVWWYSSSSSSMTPAPSDTNTTGVVVTPEVSVGTNATLGPILVAQNGMTLYTYNKDSAGISNCTVQCLTDWPAYTTTPGAPLTAGTGVTGTLATFTRTDNGTTQLTYNGMPLYFFVQDTAAGNATGQNQDGFTVVKP